MSSTSSKKTSADAPVSSLPPSELPTTVQVGRIVKAHGVRGDALIEILTDRPEERFAAGQALLLTDAAGRTRGPRQLTVQASRPYRGLLLVHFAELDNPEAIGPLRGHFLEVAAATVPPPPEGSYYHFQLVGCRCVDAVDGELGIVSDVIEDGGGILLLVERAGSSLLVPFVQVFLEGVDLDAREIRCRLPPGLVESCESKS